MKTARLDIHLGPAATTREILLRENQESTVEVGIDWSRGDRVRVEGALVDPETGVTLARLGERQYAGVAAFCRGGNERDAENLQPVLDGDADVDGQAGLSVSPAMNLRLEYRFTAGWKFVRVVPQARREIPGRPSALSVWVNGDGSGNQLRCRVRDAKGETFQPSAGAINWKGWRRIEIPLDGHDAGSWGGDGHLDYPIQWDTLFLVDSTRQACQSALEFRGPVLKYLPE